MARFQGVECMSHIPLKKIYIFTLTFSVISWLFGNEHLPAPQGFRGAAPDRVAKIYTYGFSIYTVGNSVGASVWARCEATGIHVWGGDGVSGQCLLRDDQ